MNAVAILDRFNLNPRERRLLTLMLGVLAVALVFGLPLGLEFYVMSKRGDLEETRAALAAIQSARAQVKERQAKKEALVQRYQRKAPALAGFLEEQAKAQKLTVSDATDRPETPHGKRYTERHTVIHFKKVSMGPVIRFVESIEKSGYPVSVTRFNIRKRSGEVDSFDVEVGVSAFDRESSAAK